MHSNHAISLGHEFIKQIDEQDHGSNTEYVFTLISKGSLRISYQDVLEIHENTFTLVPAGIPHRLISGENLEIWWVGFCPNCLNLQENSTIMQPFRQVRLGAMPAVKISPQRLPYIVTLLTELQDELKRKHHDQMDIIRSLLLLLLNEIKKSTSLSHSPTSSPDKVTAALDYIQQHYLRPISLKDVAIAVHSSPSHLATLVKNSTGFSIGQWIIRNRLTEACSRLLHTQIPINLIVEELGWNDTTHFIRLFKKAYGDTPAAWRKKQTAKQHHNLLLNSDH